MRKSEYPKEVKTLGQRIRKKRMDLGLSLLEVAKAAGISESYLSRIEADKQIPNCMVAMQVARKINDNDINFYISETTLKKALPVQILEQMIKNMKKVPPTPQNEAIQAILKASLPKK